MEGRGTLLTWSTENIVTVVLMAALGYFLFASVAAFIKSRNAIFGGFAAWPGSLTATRPGA